MKTLILTSLLALVAILTIALPLWRATDRIDAAAGILLEREDVMTATLETTWTSAGPKTQKVVTPRLDGEAATAWVARHKEAVQALEAAFPPQ